MVIILGYTHTKQKPFGKVSDHSDCRPEEGTHKQTDTYGHRHRQPPGKFLCTSARFGE